MYAPLKNILPCSFQCCYPIQLFKSAIQSVQTVALGFISMWCRIFIYKTHTRPSPCATVQTQLELKRRFQCRGQKDHRQESLSEACSLLRNAKQPIGIPEDIGLDASICCPPQGCLLRHEAGSPEFFNASLVVFPAYVPDRGD